MNKTGNPDGAWDTQANYTDYWRSASQFGNSSPSTNSSGSHSHTISIGSTGSGQSHNNMPPYITYYCWMRTS